MLKGLLNDCGNSVDEDGQLLQRSLVKLALDENLATIDLSDASNNIALKLVQFLCEEDWFQLFTMCRSSTTRFSLDEPGDDGLFYKDVFLNLFSSMGNGYTFELESIIFLAICRSVVPDYEWHLIRIFGDDIICPQRYVERIIHVLELCGMVINRKKSFLAGLFFESCGHDYFNNHFVRPVFARGCSSSGIPYSLQLANSLRLWSRDVLGEGKFCDASIRTAWRYLVELTNPAWTQCKIPPSMGDTGLITSFRESKHNRTRTPALNSDQWEGYYVRYIKIRSKETRSYDHGFLLMKLSQIGGTDTLSSNNFEPLRNQYGKPRSASTLIVDWPDNLSWIQR